MLILFFRAHGYTISFNSYWKFPVFYFISTMDYNPSSIVINQSRTTNYALNRDNLLKNLVKDAHCDKLDIVSEVNNYGGNVNLHQVSPTFQYQCPLCRYLPSFFNFQSLSH